MPLFSSISFPLFALKQWHAWICLFRNNSSSTSKTKKEYLFRIAFLELLESTQGTRFQSKNQVNLLRFSNFKIKESTFEIILEI